METIQGGQVPSNEPEKKRLITAIFGKEGVGKSVFALTFPPPLFIINADRNMSQYFKLMPPSTQIHYERLQLDDVDSLSPEMAKVHMAKVNKVVRDALKANEGTIIWEGEDLIWDVVKIGLLPRGDAKAREYGDANEWMNNNYRRIERSNLNMAVTSFAKPEWVGETKTSGRFIREGWKWTGRWFNSAVYMYLMFNTKPEEVPTLRNQPVDLQFTSQITESKDKKALQMRTMPRLTYMLLYKMTYGELPPEADKLWVPPFMDKGEA